MSNGRQVGTIVGSLIAAYFTAGTSYAAFAVAAGGSIGGAIGGQLDPERIQGPRLEDLKVTVSTYGAGIPYLIGEDRTGGNVIWSTDRQEAATTESQGKGGGSVKNTTYSYYVHMRIALCETAPAGKMVAISKMYADGKLVYDASTGASFASALASAIGPLAKAIIYQGWADQLPDPTMEAWKGGPGSAPAYRNIASIQLEHVDCPGGRIPQLSFVPSIVEELTDEIFEGAEVEIPVGNRISASRIFTDGTSGIFFAEYSQPSADHPTYPTKRVDVHSVDMNGATKLFSFGVDAWANYNAVPGDADVDALCFRVARPWSPPTDTGVNAFYDSQGAILTLVECGPSCLAFGQSTSSWSKRGNYGLIAGDSNQSSYSVVLFSWGTGAIVGGATIGPTPYVNKVIATDSLGWVILSNESVQVRPLDGTFGSALDTQPLPAEVVALGLGYEARFTGADGDTLALWACDPDGELALVYDVTFNGTSIVFALRNQIVRLDQTIPHPVEQTIGVAPDAAYGWQVATVGPSWAMSCFMVAFDRVAHQNVTVADAIAQLCERAGETRYDVSALPDSDTLHGYKLANPTSARANIDPLCTAFGIYIVDEDGLIKFKKYDAITSLATIGYDELGQSADGASTDLMPLSRTQAIDLPRSVTVNCIDASFDFQTASETVTRQVTQSIEDVSLDLPMVISADQARAAAQRVLYSAWRQQNTRSFKTSRKYAWLSPGDGVTVEYPRGTFKLWRLLSMNDDGQVLEFSVEPGDAEIFQQEAIGTGGTYSGQEVAPLPPQTQMVIGDWPLLRDADNNPGIYTAFRPLGVGSRGVTLYVGDDDSSLEERGTTFESCVIGVADSALGAWLLNIIDQANTLTVSAPAGAFSSITYDQLVSSQTLNAVAVGQPGRWEILQFATASYLGASVWVLSDFKRAQRGTEYAADSHQVGDMVVELKPAGMLRPNMDVGGLNQTKKYRAVSVGRSLNSIASQGYANTGESLRPFSPVNLRHSLVGADIVFAWNRRTRLSNNWLAGIVPLGEAAEVYVLTLYTDSTFATVKRVFAATTATATYTAAQMSADGYTLGQPLYVHVQQISDSVGAGHALEATL